MAKELQTEMISFLNETKSALPKIWMTSDPNAEGDGPQGGNETSGGAGNKFGPEASTADIIGRSQTSTIYRPAFEILGKPKVLKIFPKGLTILDTVHISFWQEAKL